MGIAALAAKALMVMIFIGWTLLWVLRPTRLFTNNFKNPLIAATSTRAYGNTGSYTLMYTAPGLLIAFIAAIYLKCTQRKGNKPVSKDRKFLKVNPWTYPVFARGPLSLISVGELAVFSAFVTLYTWTTYKLIANYLSRIDVDMDDKMKPRWERKFDIVGGRLGAAGAVPFAFLFFPIARLSSIMQLVNVPFEHAIRYHIWTAHIMMIIWSAHSLVYVIYWVMANEWKEFITWKKTETSGLSGVLVWIVGLLIWGTSLRPVRKHKFELFYYTHQLYLLFIIGFVLHVGEIWLAMMVPGIFLFFIDRLLRSMQSRKQVDILTVRLISAESMELTIAKLPDLTYPPASTIFLNVPAVSGFQWHPFTLTSCSSVDVNHLSILIKCGGQWTWKLREMLEQQAERNVPHAVAVEGPYGQRLDFLERYTVMVFIAGGSGISPFISIIKDLLHKVQNKQIATPEKIALIWSVKKVDEIGILSSICPCPDYVNYINFEVHIYVTQEQHDVEQLPCKPLSALCLNKPGKVRGVTGTSGNVLYATMILASFAGYMLLAGLTHGLYIYPIDHNTYNVYSRSGRGFLSLLEHMIAVCLFGGTVALCWNRKGSNVTEFSMANAPSSGSFQAGNVQYGGRPDLQGILSGFANTKGDQVGVFACGPLGMQEDVGRCCQKLLLSFHSINYEL